MEELTRGAMCPSCATITQHYLSHIGHKAGVSQLEDMDGWYVSSTAKWGPGAVAGSGAEMHQIPNEPRLEEHGSLQRFGLPEQLLALGELGGRLEYELHCRKKQSPDDTQVGVGWSPRNKMFFYYLFGKQGRAWGSSWDVPLDYQGEEISVMFRKSGAMGEAGRAGSMEGGLFQWFCPAKSTFWRCGGGLWGA